CGSSLGDFAAALTAAQGLLRVRPDSPSAQWALIRLRHDSGDLDQAYRDWKTYRPTPRIADDATLWMLLFRHHGNDMATLAEFFEIVTKFADNRHVRNFAVAALTMGEGLTERSPDITPYKLLDQFEREYQARTRSAASKSIPMTRPRSCSRWTSSPPANTIPRCRS
ncbi:tetratricopeptide repeat protein, partial [Pseudolysinimonas kribbensis]|uniref:tetratricopeptide repeat protein n=1 Tax=Pseudolysinimonas kribbensis TaxID=433641 RepID=UPI0024E0659A